MGDKIRLIETGAVGEVMLITKADSAILHLIHWKNGMEESFHARKELVPE